VPLRSKVLHLCRPSQGLTGGSSFRRNGRNLARSLPSSLLPHPSFLFFSFFPPCSTTT
jgi:hypothetical protein